MSIRRYTVPQALQWINCGIRFWRRNLLPWLVTGIFLALLSLSFLWVPFVGVFLIALLAPIVYASAFQVLHNQLQNKDQQTDTRSPLWLFPLKASFSALGDEQGLINLIMIGGGCLVASLLIQIIIQLVGGPYVNIDANFLDIGIINMARLGLGYGLGYILYVLVMASLFYALPLILLKGKKPKSAIRSSIRAMIRNHLPFLAYISALLVPLTIAGMLVHLFPLPGAAIWLLVASVIFPLLIHSAYCSYMLTLSAASK